MVVVAGSGKVLKERERLVGAKSGWTKAMRFVI